MNEHLYTTDDGLRLIQEFEGAPRLKARLCEGGAWELSYGVTFRPDGTRIREGETCTEAEAMTLFRHALGVFEDAVRDMVTVPLEPHQFSALVAWVYNIGVENARTSTVLREVNANRVYDAAAAFGMWIYATKNGYKQALRGLLRRRYAEACLFLGYDWAEACADEAIALQRERPATLPGKDKVIYKTPFKDVLSVAQRHPLDVPAALPDASAIVLTPTEPARVEVAPAPLPDSPAPTLKDALDTIPVQLPVPDAIEDEDEDELFLDTPAAPIATDAKGAAPSPATQPEVARAPSQPDSNPAASPAGSRPAPASIAPQSPAGAGASPVGVPAPPKLPDPPVPIGQQTSAVDATRNSKEWSDSAKEMWKSRRFWGLVLVLGGRLWMLKTGSNAVLGTVSDPLVMEMFSGFMVMIVGEIIQHWGERKATRPLK